MQLTPALGAWIAASGLLLVPHQAPAQLRVEGGRPDLLVVAHRGCWGEAPEVSVAAIKACEGTGVDGVEIDVHKTRDGALVLIHDVTVDRTTDGSGLVADMTLAELRRLRLRKAAGGPAAALTNERIPTLEEGLRAARGKFVVHLDYKTASLEEIAPVVRAAGMEGQVTAWVRGKADAPGQPDGSIADTIVLLPVLVDCRPGSSAPCQPVLQASIEAYDRFRPAGYFLTYRATRDFITKVASLLRPNDTRLATETLGRVDAETPDRRHAEWRALIDLGFSMILTDHPAELARLRNNPTTPGPLPGEKRRDASVTRDERR